MENSWLGLCCKLKHSLHLRREGASHIRKWRIIEKFIFRNVSGVGVNKIDYYVSLTKASEDGLNSD